MNHLRCNPGLFFRLNFFYGLLFLCNLVYAGAREIDDFRWEGVERIVAIGDLHGDYKNYLEVLRIAGLIDKRGKWSGGKTHLVQTGDIPDRGPDTIKIIQNAFANPLYVIEPVMNAFSGMKSTPASTVGWAGFSWL